VILYYSGLWLGR